MKIIKLNTVGYYFYCPGLQIENYDKHLSKKNYSMNVQFVNALYYNPVIILLLIIVILSYYKR